MGQTAKFDYYYGTQAETYSFYRIPKVLFTSPYFKKLSCEAKVLYGILLDRMSLSIKNRWFDEEGRAYIIFSIEEVKEYMGCQQQKAVKLMNELDQKNGIGLIEKKRVGFGKVNIIYVKNFLLRDEAGAPVVDETDASRECRECADPENNAEQEEENALTNRSDHGAEPEGVEDSQKYENQTSRNLKIELPEVRKSNLMDDENHTSRSMIAAHAEVRKSNFKKFENHTSRDLKITLQEVRKSNGNYTDSSNTESSETDSNQSFSEHVADDGMDREEMEIREAYEELIRENIGFDVLCAEYDRDRVTEIFTLMVDTVCSKKSKIIIGGEPVSAELVKNRFLKLGFSHIQYVFECLDKNTTKVWNIRQYLLTTLYNALSTISSYYSAEVNHDMYGTGEAAAQGT